MYKLVVLCSFIVIAAAKPDLLLTAPITSYTTYVAPATTTITKQASSVIHPPAVYNVPLLAHLVKKRSPQLPLTYIAPTTYLSTSPIATTYTSPLVQAPILPAPTIPIATTHFIKKRSAPLLSTAIVAPATYTAAAPLVASAYSAPLISSTHVIGSTPLISQPYAYNELYATHFIKKRSAPVLSTYIAPTSYSHQSRIDLQSTPLITSYGTPLTYTAPLATVSHIY